MGLLEKISEYRERQILDHAAACLDDGEKVTHWVRVRDPGKRGGGVVYLTDRRCILYWSGWSSDPTSVGWHELRSWGVDREPERGPILGIETPEATRFVQILVGTDGMVEKANAFLERFADLAPPPLAPLERSSHPSDYKAARKLRVSKEKKSMASHTRRLIVTIIGIALLAVGLVLLALPGPGILVVLAGLAVLGSEYDWAQDIFSWARKRVSRTAQRFRARGGREVTTSPDDAK